MASPLLGPLDCSAHSHSHQMGEHFGKTKKDWGQISPLLGPCKSPLGLPLDTWECQVLGVPAAPCSSLLQGPTAPRGWLSENFRRLLRCADAERAGGPAPAPLRNNLNSQPEACISLYITTKTTLGRAAKNPEDRLRLILAPFSGGGNAVK